MGGEREFLKVLKEIISEMIPNGRIKCSYAELGRFKTIIDSYISSRGDYQMRKAPDIKRELTELQGKVNGIFKLNDLQQELEHLKNDIEITEEQFIFSGNTQLVQEKLKKIIANGININQFPYLNDYTKGQVLGWTRFLNDYHIDLKVAGIDDTCYLMKNFLYKEGNMKRTKKQIDVFKNVRRRSDMNQSRR